MQVKDRIIASTIEVLAEHGFAGTTFARIVQHARLSSTRLVSYHFENKDALMFQVLLTALSRADELLNERIDGITDRVELLRAYIRAEVELLRTHPSYAKALLEVGPAYAPVVRDARVGRLERQLKQGQTEGVFGEFDVAVTAATIRHGIDGAASALTANPDVDLEVYGAELAELFVRATSPASG